MIRGLPPLALLEEWLRENYFLAELDLGGSGVSDLSFGRLREAVGISPDDLDALVLRDSRSAGDPELRRLVADRWSSGAPERVLVANGSSEAIFLALWALLRPGDEVIVLDPGYHSLTLLAEAFGCKIRRWQLFFEESFEPDLDRLRRLLTHRTRAVIVNFPHNPTGASLTVHEQTMLVELVRDVGAYLLWDTAFAALARHHEAADGTTSSYERAITFGTLSKAFGLPGLRLGWMIAPEAIVSQCVRLRDYVSLYTSPLIEYVGKRAIAAADVLLKQHLDRVRRNFVLVQDWVTDNADFVAWVPPEGGVSCFPLLGGIGDVDRFCGWLMDRYALLLVPGSCFGRAQHVRLGFGGEQKVLEAGLDRLSSALRTATARRLFQSFDPTQWQFELGTEGRIHA